jgi:hypothetical protein
MFSQCVHTQVMGSHLMVLNRIPWMNQQSRLMDQGEETEFLLRNVNFFLYHVLTQLLYILRYGEIQTNALNISKLWAHNLIVTKTGVAVTHDTT